jgi:CubicO group peptidase (beta-lactamase class C family)
MSSVVQGQCSERFEPLKALLESFIDSGRDVGASLALSIDGETLVDVWGGWVDAARVQPWQRDTIINVWSTTKPMTSLAVLMLIDRGEIDPDAPVARYWPEFAANGKGAITVRQVLAHASGVSGWAEPVRVEDLFDWEKSTSMLAAQAPWWPPGSASGYHALNYGHLLGEIVRRVTGQTLGQFFAKEIAKPLGADFHIGLADSEFRRVALVVPPEQGLDVSAIPRETPSYKTLANPQLDARESWTEDWRRAELGACNGHGNARSVMRVQSVVANGGELGGVRLLSQKTVDRIFNTEIEGVDVVLGAPLRFGLGYGLPNREVTPFIPAGRKAFWGGWGGSIVIVDADHRMAFSYVMNRMEPGALAGRNAMELTTCLYQILGS